jgi:hypothetical protein
LHDQHAVGEIITLEATFVRVSDGTLATPTTVTLTIIDGSTTTTKNLGDLTVVAAGRLSYDYTTINSGVLEHRWVASGNGVSADFTEYVVIGKAAYDGPCDLWLGPVDVFDCKPASSVAAASRDYLRAAEMAAAATRILFNLSNRRYPGICLETVRPCRRTRDQTPRWWHESWGSCGCASLSACGCSGVSEIRLGGRYPVLGVKRVRVDGTTLASSAYRIDDDFWLVRTDDESWPGSQDLAADPASANETFDVQFFYGRPVPDEGVVAAKRLASELYMLCSGGTCSLPSRVQTLSRQGETIAFLDPQEFLAEGRTGLYEVDLFLENERYRARNLGTAIASPDLVASRRRTAT